MAEMPTLGEAPKKSPLAPIAITAVVIGLAAGGVYWFTHRPAAPATPPQPVAAAPAPTPAPAPAPAPVAPAPAPAAAPVAVAAPQGANTFQAPTPAAAAAAAPKPDAKDEKLKSLSTTINGPLEKAIVDATSKDVGTPLTQVVTRSLVWWIRVPNDLTKGDELKVVYEERANQEPVVHAVRYTSKKLGKTLEAFRFQADGDAFSRFYVPEGEELELSLVDGPLDSWEQITSRLKDGRGHKGIDFKTAINTPVKATFDGTITKKNWNWKGAGNCLEVTEAGGKGRVAKFFHLSELPKDVVVGNKVKKGEVIAHSGNTGHSFAPHLHYQLEKNGAVIDPFDSHDTFHKKLDAKQLPKLQAQIDKLNKLLASSGGAAGGFGAR
jgi:murein DD-endopeptidase MepM/ murein hydrolase activator NlpD